MYRILTMFVLLGAVFAPTFVFAASSSFREGSYFSMHAGAAHFEHSQVGPTFGLATGYSMGGMRPEFEVSGYQNRFHSSGQMQRSLAFMANVYYDFNNLRDVPVVPYLGIGAGIGYTDPGTEFAYQGMAGFSWNVADDGQFYAGYRYFSIPRGPSYSITSSTGVTYRDRLDYNSHILEVGFRTYF